MTDVATTTEAGPPAGGDRTPLVELRNIRVAFGGVHAVDGVSVDLYAGEVIGLVGGNGAGKSTLMHTLSGAHPADSGEILINGTPVTINNPRDAQKHGIDSAPLETGWPGTLASSTITIARAASRSRRSTSSASRRCRRLASSPVSPVSMYSRSMGPPKFLGSMTGA